MIIFFIILILWLYVFINDLWGGYKRDVFGVFTKRSVVIGEAQYFVLLELLCEESEKVKEANFYRLLLEDALLASVGVDV